MSDKSRPEFRQWVDRQVSPDWGIMPLTHICKALLAQDIVRDGCIEPSECEVLGRSLAYFFYGRPAYRTHGDGSVKNVAACPMCFIFDPKIVNKSQEIHPFDTGAFKARLYKHIVMSEMEIADFSLEKDISRPNRLINAVFGSREAYFENSRNSIIDPDKAIQPSEFLVNTYIELIRSAGRNEPDDRVGTIEVIFGSPVAIEGNLIALVIPDILWNDKDKTDWVAKLASAGVEILPFRYSHGRDPEHHHAMIEVEVREYFKGRGDLGAQL